VRLNRDEFAALAGFKPEGGALTGYGRDNLTVVALSGEIDHVSDGFRLVTIENGDPAMGLVTAMGCACSAVTAAFLAVEKDAWTATASALVAFGVAGEIAGTEARGPGSFAVAMLDVLHRLDRERLISAARIV
jgi:hydroxyethylthiazole kinase